MYQKHLIMDQKWTEKNSLRGQTVIFVHCKRIPQQGNSLFFFFCSLTFFDRSDKILTCIKTWLWNPRTYRRKFVLLSSAQFGLLRINTKINGPKGL